MDPEKTIKLIVSAIESAHSRYERISNGYWLGSGSEYFLTNHIANYIFDEMDNVYCTVEENVTEFRLGRGRHKKHLRISGKVDVAIWSEQEQALGAIEAKSQTRTSACELDVRRLSNFAWRSADGAHGFLAYYWSAIEWDPLCLPRELEGRINRLDELQNKILGRPQIDFASTNSTEIVREDDETVSGWLAYAAAFSRKRGREG